jgi:Tfp pilus assembly protein PilN
MLNRTQFWTLTAGAALALVVALVNMYLYQANRTLQAEVSDRGQFIQQSAALETLYRQIVNELADRAVRTRDEQVRAMFEGLGIKLNFDEPSADKGKRK